MTKNEFIQRMVISMGSNGLYQVYSDEAINNFKSLAYKLEKNGVLFDPDPKEVLRDHPKYDDSYLENWKDARGD